MRAQKIAAAALVLVLAVQALAATPVASRHLLQAEPVPAAVTPGVEATTTTAPPAAVTTPPPVATAATAVVPPQAAQPTPDAVAETAATAVPQPAAAAATAQPAAGGAPPPAPTGNWHAVDSAPLGTGTPAVPLPADAPLFNTAEPNRGFSAGVAAGLAELASGQAGTHMVEDAAAVATRVSKLLPLPFGR